MRWSMMMMGLVGMMAMGSTTAGSPPASLIPMGEMVSQQRRQPVFEVERIQSPLTIDDMDAFVWDASARLRALSSTHQASMCATICTTYGGRAPALGMIVTTSKQQDVCPIVPQCPDRMIETPYRLRTQWTQEAALLSPQDLDTPSLYLVLPTLVLFHDASTLRVVRHVDVPRRMDSPNDPSMGTEGTRSTP